MADTYNITIGGSTAASPTSDVAANSTGGGITPQNSALLSQLMDGAFSDGNFDANDLKALNAILGASSGGATATPAIPKQPAAVEDELTDAEFLSAVNDIAHESDEGIGPGEKMMLEQADRLIAGKGSSEDKQAFLDEATKLLNNEDQNGDGPKDIDEKNGKEGSMLKSLTTALLADKDEATETAETADPSDPNAMISSFLERAFADKKLSDTEVAGLQALLGVDADGTAATPTSGSTSTSDRTPSNYGYKGLMEQFIMRDAARNLLNDDSIKKALAYVDGDDA